jgi:transposase
MLAMRTRNGNLHLEIQTSRKSPVGILRTSFRDKNTGKMAHTQHGRITGCTLEELKMLQLAFRQKVVPADSPAAFRTLQSKEYGASRALLQLARELGLHRILYSRTEPWVEDVLAMIVGRIVYQGSKLSLCNQWMNTTLWEQCGVEGRPDVEDHCYLPLDRLLERQRAIQKKLAAKHLKNGALVLYDITSTYFEGAYEHSEIVIFGHNRDQKNGHEQVVIGLLCTTEGCPVGCEVFPGNTNDSTTVVDKIAELRQCYGLEKIVFVGDRGMITEARLGELDGVEGLNTISALTHRQILKLLKRKVIQTDLFDERHIVEVIDPENEKERYCLCRNPLTAQSERQTRQRLIELSQEGLEKIAAYQKKTSVETLGARIGKLLAKYKVGKFFHWEVVAAADKHSREHRVVWTLDEQKVAQEQLLDGCYIVRTDVSTHCMDKDEVVAGYKGLAHVERAFRSLKTPHLEIRPVFHKKDERIQAHIFLCTLAYYLQWHMVQRLRPLFESDGEGKDRRWTVENVIERLKQIQRNEVEANGVRFHQITELDPEQKRIIELLQMTL